MKTQYNFKIEDTLKEELEEIQQNSNISSKEEFLSQLLNSFKQQQANETDTEIDMSQYEEINAETKAKLSDTFKHIIYTIQANTADMKQQAISVEKEKLAIIDERTAFQKHIEEMKAKYNQDILDIQKKSNEEINAEKLKMADLKSLLKEKVSDIEKVEKETTSLKQELEQAQAIAIQTKAVMTENKELREATQELKRESEVKQKQHADELAKSNQTIKQLEQTNFKQEFENEELSKKLSKLQELEKDIKQLEKENTILTTKLEMMTTSKEEEKQ